MVRSIKKEILNKKSLKQNKYEGKLCYYVIDSSIYK